MLGSGTSVRERWRRVLLGLGCVVMVFGLLHHVDHVVRGNHSMLKRYTGIATISIRVMGPTLRF